MQARRPHPGVRLHRMDGRFVESSRNTSPEECGRPLRAVAILASHNEERHIAGCLEHLFDHGIEVYLVDNSSTDRTVEIAERYLGSGLLGIENFPREEDVYPWRDILKRKEELALTIEADWLMHADPDEIRLPPRSGQTLAEAFAEVADKGYNAVNFLEFTFVPTRGSPDHDHPDFRETMRSYYPFMNNFPFQIKAWKKQPVRVDLASKNGHSVEFPGRLLYPESFKMRHYPYLSLRQGMEKYFGRHYDAAVSKTSWRQRLERDRVRLAPGSELNVYTTDDELSTSNPRFEHIVEHWASPLPKPGLGKPGSGKPDFPIIVGGCVRSGTSLVRRVLDSHSRVYCGPEVKFFQDFYGDYGDDPIKTSRFFPSARRMVTEQHLMNTVGRSFVALHRRAAARDGKRRWADKVPENVLHLKDWESLLGDDWVFVQMVRNPLDTLASIKEAEFHSAIPPDLDGRIGMYKRYTLAGLEFREQHPERHHMIVYERFTQDPKQVVSDLMAWLGEDFEAVQLNFNSVRHQSGLEDQKVRETAEVHAKSVGRWKEILSPEEAQKISEECGAVWRQALAVTDASAEAQSRRSLRGAIGDVLRRLH